MRPGGRSLAAFHAGFGLDGRPVFRAAGFQDGRRTGVKLRRGAGTFVLVGATLVLSVFAARPLSAAGGSSARPDSPAAPLAPASATSADSVMAPLQHTLAWYQQARMAMQSVRGVLEADF